ncbi:MAG TPA: hypothetical protein VNW97_12490 [Candidatus Saccharimonadales bacterium]|jgi:hypothetical protein|nr:hypothetical protein [Candidatus Saccharimonadales bacterium]
MTRAIFPSVVLAFALTAVQAQVQTHGVPASVTSATPDGKVHGVPSSITSPTPVVPRTFGDPNARVVFGSPHPRHNRHDVTPVPIFYPVYIDTGSTPAAQPAAESNGGEGEASAAETEALRDAYNRGAQDALTELRARQRVKERASEAQERPQVKPPARDEKKTSAPSEAEAHGEATTARVPVEEQPPTSAPPAVFVFKDGHRLETQNFAIVGQTLFDFTPTGLHKIKLAELDLDATRRINEDSGIPVTLP